MYQEKHVQYMYRLYNYMYWSTLDAHANKPREEAESDFRDVAAAAEVYNTYTGL